MWDLGLILSACAGALRGAARSLDEEQAALGIDALDELEIHPILRRGLTEAGFGVISEQRYPQAGSRPRRSEGDRCDIVLTERPGDHLIDPLASHTLFGERGVEPEAALWLEVKVVGQFSITDGMARANPGYTSGLLSALTADVRKLAADDRIAHGAALLVLFNSDERIAEHDLGQWTRAVIERGLPISSPLCERFSITDRIGNGIATVALVQTHHM